MKRTNGYVVGRKTVRGIPTWSVKVQDDSHPLNGTKLSVVGDAPNLRPALDVDFLVLEQDGLSIAADVSPRGVVSAQLEGTKQMVRTSIRRYGAIIAIAVIAVVVVFMAVFARQNSQEVSDKLLVGRVELVLIGLKVTAFSTMVPDIVVREAMHNRWRTYSAYKAALDHNFCLPIFGSRHDSKEDRRCYNALYDAKTGSAAEGRLKRDGLPVGLARPVKLLYETVTEKGRKFLGQPDNLVPFYRAKKPVILAEFRTLTAPQQMGMVEDAKNFRRALELWRDDSSVRQLAEQLVSIEEKYYSQTDVKRWNDQETSARIDTLYVQLDKLVPTGHVGESRELIQFVHRRAKEGGMRLVKAYIEVVDDFLAAVT